MLGEFDENIRHKSDLIQYKTGNQLRHASGPDHFKPFTRYTHMGAIKIKVKQKVGAGQPFHGRVRKWLNLCDVIYVWALKHPTLELRICVVH